MNPQLVPVFEPKTREEAIARAREVRARIAALEGRAAKFERIKAHSDAAVASRIASAELMSKQFDAMHRALYHLEAGRKTRAGIGAIIYDAPVGPQIMREPIRLTGRQAIVFCSKVFGVSVVDMESNRRTLRPTFARQCASWLCRRSSLLSLPQIGAMLGGRDHTTIYHAVARIDAMMSALKISTTDPVKAISRLAKSGRVRP